VYTGDNVESRARAILKGAKATVEEVCKVLADPGGSEYDPVFIGKAKDAPEHTVSDIQHLHKDEDARKLRVSYFVNRGKGLHLVRGGTLIGMLRDRMVRDTSFTPCRYRPGYSGFCPTCGNGIREE
jgi:hypothetical protein